MTDDPVSSCSRCCCYRGYVTVSWGDEAVHSVTPGAAAAAAYLMLARLDLMPDVSEEFGATRRSAEAARWWPACCW